VNLPTRKGTARVFTSPLGPFSVLFESKSGQILASGFTSQLDQLVKMVPGVELDRASREEVKVTSKAVDEFLDSYFSGIPHAPANLTLNIEGTDFQRGVWREIQKIPFAATASYRDMAERTGKPNSYRAAGSACGANKTALFIPCHRVVETAGNTGKYKWGCGLKEALLNHERSFSR